MWSRRQVIIYASFGLDNFEPAFMHDADYEDDADDKMTPNPRGCHSVVGCFWLILYKGVPVGSLDAVLDVVKVHSFHKFKQYVGLPSQHSFVPLRWTWCRWTTEARST